MSDHKMQAVERPARLTGDARVDLDYVRHYEITMASLTAGVFRAALEPGDHVVSVRAMVATIFDGTTPLLKVGDVGDDNCYVDALDLTAVGGANSLVSALAAAVGKLYAAADQIVMTVTHGGGGGGTPTVGKVIVEVVLAGHPNETPRYEVNVDAYTLTRPTGELPALA